MTLQGSLADIQLPDIVQLVSTTGKTGMFLLKRHAQEGRIYLKDGQIVHAELDDLVGEDAVYEMAIWSEGEFTFHPGVAAPQITIHRSNTNLFMEAARRIDEWRVLSRKIPSVDMVPELIPNLPQGRSHVQLNTGEWMVLAQINGRRSIREIARLCNISLFDTAKILYGLITHGLVRLCAAPVSDEPARDTGVQGAGVETGTFRTRVTEDMAASGVTEASRDRHLLQYLERVQAVSEEVLGADAREIIQIYCQQARQGIANGQGMEAVREAVVNIVKAVARTQGADTVARLLKRIRAIKIS